MKPVAALRFRTVVLTVVLTAVLTLGTGCVRSYETVAHEVSAIHDQRRARAVARVMEGRSLTLLEPRVRRLRRFRRGRERRNDRCLVRGVRIETSCDSVVE